jgi:serine/threonine protein kinase
MSTEPRHLGKYELQQRLAQGGQGEVWKALDTQLRRYVAIKLLHTDLQHDPDFAARFEREAQLIAALRHPNIVQIHDFRISQPPESEQTTAYMVMDYVEGQTLSDYIRSTSRKGHFPDASDIVYLFTGISLAIDYAHGKGMIHRDIKPANILLDQRLPTARAPGEPVLTDFGIARLQGVATGTVVGSLLGTPLYISPEQAKGLHGDKRSDLYSLGVILYEMTTGITPFRGDTTIAILMQHLHDMPTPPSLINPNIPPMVSTVILKSLAKQPEDRFSSASAMTIALAQALNVPVPRSLIHSSELPPARPVGPSTPAMPSSGWPSPPYSAQLRPPMEMQQSAQTPAHAGRVAASTPANAFISSLPGPGSAMQHSAAPQAAGQQWRKGGKGRMIALIALLAIVLLGGGLGAFMLFSHPAASPVNPVAGRIHFSSSGHAPAGSYDQLQIDLTNIPQPHAGKVYYAWIDAPGSENERPHWKLSFSNGAIHAANLSYPGYSNLLAPNTIFLITEENATTPPVVPNPLPTGRLYYAQISQTSSTSFDIQACPAGNAGGVCMQ